MFKASGIIFRLDANYNQIGIERITVKATESEVKQKIVDLSREMPLTPLQLQFGGLYLSNVFLDGEEYVITEQEEEYALKSVEEILREGED